MGVNNLPRVVAQPRPDWFSNPRRHDCTLIPMLYHCAARPPTLILHFSYLFIYLNIGGKGRKQRICRQNQYSEHYVHDNTEKIKKNRYVRSNSRPTSLGNYVVSPEEEKERLQWEGFAVYELREKENAVISSAV